MPRMPCFSLFVKCVLISSSCMSTNWRGKPQAWDILTKRAPQTTQRTKSETHVCCNKDFLPKKFALVAQGDSLQAQRFPVRDKASKRSLLAVTRPEGLEPLCFRHVLEPCMLCALAMQEKQKIRPRNKACRVLVGSPPVWGSVQLRCTAWNSPSKSWKRRGCAS
jgi:hypothetical protein